MKAQVWPNSSGVPKRLAGISAMAVAANADSGLPVCFEAAAKPLVSQRLLLDRDVEKVKEKAGARWDAVMAGSLN